MRKNKGQEAAKNFGGYMEVFLNEKGSGKSPEPLLFLGGQYWFRTSDLLRVRVKQGVLVVIDISTG
jgi:hypothetical protein